jgi:putative spermidine/putrescine transport system substrate-binding protein
MSRTPALPRRALLAAGALAGGLPRAEAQPMAAPAPAPIELAVLDLANLHLAAPMLRDFEAASGGRYAGGSIIPGEIGDIPYEIREAVEAGAASFDLAFAPLLGARMGIEAGIWQPLDDWLLPALPPLEALLSPAALAGWGRFAPFALPIVLGPGGPLLCGRPGRFGTLPASPAALLDWARENPGRFLYARPPLSPSGWMFVGALPHLLGDRDPTDPVNGWDRTWPYLRELGRQMSHYAVADEAAAEEFADGDCDLLALTIAEDIAFRRAGLLPADLLAAGFEGQHWAPGGTR